MTNKTKAIFAAIGTIGALMLAVSAMVWIFTNYPGGVMEILIITWFTYIGHSAYKFFLKEFEDRKRDEQLNS